MAARLRGLALAVLTASLASSSHAKDKDPLDYPVVSSTNLTERFHTKTPWRLVVTQEPSTPVEEGGRPVPWPGLSHVCFLQRGNSRCQTGYAELDSHGQGLTFASIQGLVIFDQKKRLNSPLLVLNAIDDTGGGSAVPYGPTIWVYRRTSDEFVPIFHHRGNFSSTEEVRFVADGPLAGSILSNTETERWPYPFIIRVYKLQNSDRFSVELQYKSRTKYRDGNPLPVLDEEMPEIERRLGFWKLGDPLPVPPHMPHGCTTLELHNGVEQCR